MRSHFFWEFPGLAPWAAVAPPVLGFRPSEFTMAGVFGELRGRATIWALETWNQTSWGREIGPGLPARPIRPKPKKSGTLQGENFLTQCDRNKQLESAESLSTKLWFEHICQKMATCGCISTACWSFLGHFPGFGFLQFFQNAGSGRGVIPCLRVSSERACQGLLESGLKPKIRLTVQKLWRKHFWNFGPFWNGVDAKKFDRAQLFNQTCFCHKN